MSVKIRTLASALSLAASLALGQTSQTIGGGVLQLPPVTVNGVAVPQPSVPLPTFTVQFPKASNATNFWNVTNTWNLTNRYSVTNFTFLTVTQTNVVPVWITNVLPNYIPSLVITGQTKFTSIYVSTNSPTQ